MKIAKLVCMVVIALMLFNGYRVLTESDLFHGAGMDVFNAGLKDPWQAFINFDLMSGLLLMVAWVIFREKGGSWMVTATWVAIILWWGNIVVAVYILRELGRANGDWTKFFLGKRGGLDPASGPVSVVERALLVLAAVGVVAFIAWALPKTGYESTSVTGVVWGFAPFIPALLLAAFRDRLARA